MCDSKIEAKSICIFSKVFWAFADAHKQVVRMIFTFTRIAIDRNNKLAIQNGMLRASLRIDKHQLD